jgi:RNA-binding protein PNO1
MCSPPPTPLPFPARAQGGKTEMRRVRIPAHRYSPLKENWKALMGPVVEHLKLQIRMNTSTRMVELKVRGWVQSHMCCGRQAPFARPTMPPSPTHQASPVGRVPPGLSVQTSEHTVDPGALQKGEDFIRAFVLGFEVQDSVALLRLDDLYIESFEVGVQGVGGGTH